MGKYILGIDIGGTRTKVGIADCEKLQVAASEVFSTEKYDLDIFFAQLLAAVTCICDRCGVSCGELAGAGVGIGSYIFREGGTVDSTWGYIPCLDGVALEALIVFCVD